MNKRGELKINRPLESNSKLIPVTWVGKPKTAPDVQRKVSKIEEELSSAQLNRAIATTLADVEENYKKVIAAFQVLCKEMLEKNYEVSWGYGQLNHFKDLKDVVAYLQGYIQGELRGNYRLLSEGKIIALDGGFIRSDYPGGTLHRPDFETISRFLLEGKNLTYWLRLGEEPKFVTIYIIPAINMQKVKPVYFIVGETWFNRFTNGGLAERVKDTAKFVLKLTSDLLRKEMLHAIPKK